MLLEHRLQTVLLRAAVLAAEDLVQKLLLLVVELLQLVRLGLQLLNLDLQVLEVVAILAELGAGDFLKGRAEIIMAVSSGTIRLFK